MSQYHHYVPRFILRNFAIDDHHVKPSDRKRIKTYSIENKISLVKSIAKSYGKVDMYKDINNKNDVMFVEKELCKLENTSSRIILRIITCETKMFTVTRSELRDLKKFLFIMLYRSNSRRNQYIDGNFDAITKEDINLYMKYNNFSTYSEVWIDNIKKIMSLSHEDIMTQTLRTSIESQPEDKIYHAIASEYAEMCRSFICVWEAEEGSEFILTDKSFGIYEGHRPFATFHQFYIITPRLVIVTSSQKFRDSGALSDITKSFHNIFNLKKSWFHEAPHSQPSVVYNDGLPFATDFTKFTDTDKFTYNISTLPKKFVHLINLIGLNETSESITYKTEQCLLKTLRFYNKCEYSYNRNYDALNKELIDYINRTHPNYY